VREVEFRSPRPEIEMVWRIEFAVCEQGIASLNFVDDGARTLGLSAISQNRQQTLAIWAMVCFRHFAIATREAYAVPDFESALATGH